MNKRWLFAVAVLALTTGALALRLPRLSQRPMHGDEAVHTVKFNELWQSGTYRYDPEEYHGPTLYYLTLPVVWLSGARDFATTSEITYRVVPALLGACLIPLMWWLRDGLERWAIVMAAALTASSPALTFYSRYYIQETLLVFFTFSVIVTGWRYARTGKIGWILAAGAAVGFMHGTKETCLIAYGALACALIITLIRHARKDEARARLRERLRVRLLIVAVVAAVVVSVLLYSALFTNPRGPIDSLCTYGTYFERAGSSGLHDHPWYYYLKMLVYTKYTPGPAWSEGLILVLAALGVMAAATGVGIGKSNLPFLRFLALYTLLLTGMYSAIPYKTPWCILSFLHGMVLLAGVGAVVLIRCLRFKPLQLVGILTILGAGWQLGAQAHRTCFKFHADPRNPYVYAHPVNDVVRLGRRVVDLARVHPDGQAMLVKVLTPDCWPLPWYLRGLTRVGYWENVPAQPDAPVVIAAAEFGEKLGAQLHDAYVASYYGQRPDATLLLYVESKLWDAYLKEQMSTGVPRPKADSE